MPASSTRAWAASPTLGHRQSACQREAPAAAAFQRGPGCGAGGGGGGGAAGKQEALARSTSAEAAQPVQQELGPGAAVACAGRRFLVTEPLGEGSFGIVWAAEEEGGATVAIKEIPCRSESELARVALEGHLLQLVGRELRASPCAGAVAGRVPALVASEMGRTAARQWRVRLVMSRVLGAPLEQFLGQARRIERARGVCSPVEARHQFALACRYAGALLVQLAPTLEAFSARVYHRDVTPRNILVDDSAGQSDPQFALVDFGLAVDASKWRAEEEGTGDLGGDGRYWPASAWFVFGYGTQVLEQHPSMRHEYRTGLDVHSLGITALRCLMEMLPNLPETCQDAPEIQAAVPKLRSLRAAWARYWSDARRFWQPVYDAFRGSGDFEALRTAYVRAGVHRIIDADLCTLRAALQEARQACDRLSSETGLAGMPALFDALLLMVQPGGEGEKAPQSPAAQQQPQGKPGLPRSNSVSTASPDSSPSSSASSGGDSDFGDLDSAARTAGPPPAGRAPRLSEAWGAEMEKQTPAAWAPAA